MVHGRKVEVFWARDVPEAHWVRVLLDDAGIAAFVEGESLQGATGELPVGPATSPRVCVPEGTEERARALIAEWEKSRAEEAAAESPRWTCADCGEQVEGNFDICWNCQGTNRRSVVLPPPPPPPPPPSPPINPARGPLRGMMVFVAWLGGQFVGAVPLGIYAGATGVDLDELLPWVYLLSGLGGVVGVYFGTRVFFGGVGAGRIPAQLGWRGTTWRSAVAALSAGCVWGLLWFATNAWVFPFEGEWPETPMAELMTSSWFGFFTWAALLVVFAPPTEELLFRGAMLYGFMQRWSATTSVFLTTVIFVALHIPEAIHHWPALVFIGIMGLACALIRLRTQSLVPAVLLHLAYNLTIVVGVLL